MKSIFINIGKIKLNINLINFLSIKVTTEGQNNKVIKMTYVCTQFIRTAEKLDRAKVTL